MPERRQYPRLPHDSDGALEIAPPQSEEPPPEQKSKYQFFPVTTSSVSCEGASVMLRANVEPDIRRKQVVHLHLQAEDQQLRIPAQVAWSARSDGRRLLGLHLALALADSTTRQRYANWIVSETRRALSGGKRQTHGVVPVSPASIRRAAESE